MMTLWLNDSQAQVMIRHVMAEAPHEACGLIGGKEGRAEQIVPVANIAADREHRFEMDYAALGKALFTFDEAGLSLIGIYHSHPKGRPIPSPTDIREAAYPDTAYVIIGLGSGQPELSAWHIQRGSVEPVTLTIGGQPPDPPDDTPLSRAQQIAILITALLALILMIALSLSLLPPPSPLPAMFG